MLRYLIIAVLIWVIWWVFTSRGRPPRRPERIEEDFRLAKTKWARGGWNREEAAVFLDSLVICCGREDLRLSRRNGGVFLNKLGSDATHGLNT